MAASDVDLVVHCGDYIYENGSPGGPRVDPLPESVDLEQYRSRWALYRTDEHLRAAHAIAPWIMTPDDHEVDNDYTGGTPEEGSPTPGAAAFAARRAAAYRAWWENTPARVPEPRGPNLRLYRRVRWGALADFTVLDTRQYRTDQCVGTIAPTVGPRCDASSSAQFTVLGADQERWFADAMRDRPSTWTAIVQQVVLHQWRFAPGDGVWNLDQWDGYPAARARLLDALGAGDHVVLTGDVHSSWVSDLRRDFDHDGSERVGTEFVAPGVASEAPPALRAALPVLEHNSPHIRWSEATKRGWVRHEVTPSEWRAEFRLVDDANMKDSPVATASRWAVPAGAAVARA
jgi:alkaline phosphatase D